VTVHLEAEDLDRYLRRDLPPAHLDATRRHLDACAPCWNRWNAHRWTAARHHPLHDQLAQFLGPSFRPGHDSSRALATEWDRADPRTPDEVAAFFRDSTNYLYNLVIWEASGHRPRYVHAALPTLRAKKVRTVLDIGSGIGSDAITLARHGFTVTTCDHDSPSTRFAHRRHGGTIPRIDPEHLGHEHAPDALWIIDTLDHLADPHHTLAPLLPRARIVITEDLRENRAHGRQRFHHRRPLADTTRMLARYDLTPTTHAPITIWARDSARTTAPLADRTP
jgi:hypothetical protein